MHVSVSDETPPQSTFLLAVDKDGSVERPNTSVAVHERSQDICDVGMSDVVMFHDFPPFYRSCGHFGIVGDH